MSELIFKYRVASSFILIWTIALVTWVTYQVFENITLITMPVASALAAVFGLPAVAVGLYKWRSEK